MELQGMRVNRVEPQDASFRLFPAEAVVGLTENMPVYRNHDQEFERLLEKKSAERRIGVSLIFRETNDGFALDISDENGIATTVVLAVAKQSARHAADVQTIFREHLGKLGNTDFRLEEITFELSEPWFIPVASLNALRREAVIALEARRKAAYRRPPNRPALVPPAQYPESALSYLGNVFNEKARAFYARHGVSLIDAAYETGREKNAVPLMISKHCLRYSFNLCPKQVKGIQPEPLTLINGKEDLTLVFDCRKCEMLVVGKLQKRRTTHLVAS